MMLVEGQFIFKIPALRDIFDFKIFVEVDDDIRLSRMGIILNNIKCYMRTNI
jgi:uridine kinase